MTSPPTLYRYFPNKYAVLRALGDRLMQRQNEVFERMLDNTGETPNAQANVAETLLSETLWVTCEQPGALAIMRALRASPSLQQVRLSSHHEVTEAWVNILEPSLPAYTREELWAKARLTVELGYAVIEMAMEETRPAPETMLKEAAQNLTAYWADILAPKKE